MITVHRVRRDAFSVHIPHIVEVLFQQFPEVDMFINFIRFCDLYEFVMKKVSSILGPHDIYRTSLRRIGYSLWCIFSWISVLAIKPDIPESRAK